MLVLRLSAAAQWQPDRSAKASLLMWLAVRRKPLGRGCGVRKKKRGALRVISMWGVDFLPVDLLRVDEIEATARAVTQESFWVSVL
jgi:hypothetical protein